MKLNLVRGAAAVALVAIASLAQVAQADLLFDGGAMITHPGGMTGASAGADRSAISPNTPAATGFGFGGTGTFRLADDFTVANDFTINSVTVYGYLTGATTVGGTALNFNILDGMPGVGSVVATGAAGTFSAAWAPSPSTLGIFRTTNTDTAGNTRRIQALTLSGLNINLTAGTYWLDFNYTGISFTPPVSSATSFPTGNAMQFNGTAWGNLLDAGAGLQVALPFLIEGTQVPEPAAASLLVLGAVAGLARRRRIG